MARRRADVVLAERGIFSSREQARAAVLAGEVRVDGEPLRKAGELIDEDADVVVAERPRFVSRGGEKLAAALGTFAVLTDGVRAIDVGASTGGFTDCLLKAGADSVTALDVGYGQLAWSLRNDDRVTVLERTNVRSVDARTIGGPFDLVVCDVSFISLEKVLPVLVDLTGPEGSLLALVKPQFEAGKSRVGKRGVVRDPEVHREVLERVVALIGHAGLAVRGLTWSPLKGPEGNIEFWVYASRTGTAAPVRPAELVAAAHEALGG